MDKDKNLNRIKAVLAEKHVTSKWCSQKTQPDLQTINQISKLLDVKRSELIVD